MTDTFTLDDITLASVTQSCTNCAAALAPAARFCSLCGTAVTAVSEVRSRFMTVLFCDLKSSTAITESLGDEAMFGVITQFQQLCTEAVAEHGGFVAKFMGDGMLAYFGYPEAMKNSASGAVAAADQIIGRVGGITLPNGKPLIACAGAATGWVVVGQAQPGTNAAEKMAIGWTVNLAARLQGLAGPGQIAVSEDAGRRLDPGQFALTPLGARAVQGLAAPVDIWLASPARSDATTQGFVGRDPLRQALTQLWDEIGAGPQVVEIEAPAGYGKTTLARQFLADLPTGTAVLEVQGEQHRRDQSFACLRRFVRGLAGLDPAMPRAAQQARLADWAPAGSAPGLGLLLGLNDDLVPPLVRREMILQAVLTLFSAMVPAEPALLLIEDAHWLDADTLGVLQALQPQLATRPLLILTTRRPEGTALPNARTIELGRMDATEALALIATLDTNARVPSPLRDQIVTQAQGVPLYVQHFTKAILERPTATDLPLPLTMIEALHERFDHIGDARATVEAAAILGTEIRVDVLAALIKRPVDWVSVQLAELIARGLFAPGSDGTVIFDHALIRDAVVGTLLTGQRTQLHERALVAWAAVAPDRFDSTPTIAAYHLMGAGQPAVAIPKLIEAARHSLLRNEIAESVRLLRKAEGALPDIAAGPLRDMLEMLTRFSLGLSLVQHRGFSDPEVVRSYDRALALCLETKAGSETEFQIAWGIWGHMIVVGDMVAVQQITARMEAIALTEPSLAVLASAARSVMECILGQFSDQAASMDQTRAAYDHATHGQQALTYSMDSLEMALLFNIHRLYIIGDLPGWQAAMAEAFAHEDQLGMPFLRPYIRIFGNAPRYYALPPGDHVSELAADVGYAAQIGQPFWVVSGMSWLAREKARAEGVAAAKDDLAAVQAQMHGMGLALSRASQEALLAQSYALCGDFGAARTLIDTAMAAIAAGRDGMHAAEVFRVKAEVELLLNHDAVPQALTDLDHADSIATTQDARAWSALIAASRARIMARDIGQDRAMAWLNDRLASLTRPGSEDHPAFVAARQAFSRPM